MKNNLDFGIKSEAEEARKRKKGKEEGEDEEKETLFINLHKNLFNRYPANVENMVSS